MAPSEIQASTLQIPPAQQRNEGKGQKYWEMGMKCGLGIRHMYEYEGGIFLADYLLILIFFLCLFVDNLSIFVSLK